jgi:probable rRNA maturation factor
MKRNTNRHELARISTKNSFVQIRADSCSSSNLTLTITPSLGKPFAPLLTDLIPRAAQLLKSPLRDLSVIFVNDTTMSDIHAQFMNDPTATDVMTFPLDLDPRGRPVSGEVYICIPQARREAKLRGTTAQREVLLYALHGLLHLSGFDDRTDRDYRRMHRREDQILTKLGVGPVFAPRSDRSPPASKRHRA